jgi:hypothetical protein
MAMSFVPHALMAGFCSGAAIIIALSQMTNIMGKLYTLKQGLSRCLYHCLETEVFLLFCRYVEAGGGGEVIVYYESQVTKLIKTICTRVLEICSGILPRPTASRLLWVKCQSHLHTQFAISIFVSYCVSYYHIHLNT